MKNILKNKTVAVVICALLVYMGLFMGVNRPIGNMKDEALVHFYGDGDVIGIKNDLDTKVETAYSLMSIAKRYIDEDEAVITDLVDACEEVRKSETPGEAYEANMKMDGCYGKLKSTLDSMKLSKKDEDYNYSLLSQYNSSDMIISHSEYNTLAGEVNRKLSKFPAGLVSKLTFTSKMELYGQE